MCMLQYELHFNQSIQIYNSGSKARITYWVRWLPDRQLRTRLKTLVNIWFTLSQGSKPIKNSVSCILTVEKLENELWDVEMMCTKA